MKQPRPAVISPVSRSSVTPNPLQSLGSLVPLAGRASIGVPPATPHPVVKIQRARSVAYPVSKEHGPGSLFEREPGPCFPLLWVKPPARYVASGLWSPLWLRRFSCTLPNRSLMVDSVLVSMSGCTYTFWVGDTL